MTGSESAPPPSEGELADQPADSSQVDMEAEQPQADPSETAEQRRARELRQADHRERLNDKRRFRL
jgi:hypothetical protein